VPPHLKLVDRAGTDVWPAFRRPLVLALLLAGTAALATLAGADRSRTARPAREIARDALTAALARGSEDEHVGLAARTLRRRLGRQPLDARTRVAYAGVLHGLSRSVADTAAATFHARLAAASSPVTVPIVRAATVVLARSGEWGQAVDSVATMFGYDPGAAARLLLTLESRLPVGELTRALPDDPAAWLAWVDTLRAEGRGDDGIRWLDRALARWPDHGALIDRVATRLSRDADLDGLAALYAVERAIAETPTNARAFAFRARARALEGDATEARADIELALRLDGDNPRLLLVAGDACETLGDDDGARRLWSRAQFAAPPDSVTLRVRALVRLARLEDRRGRAGNALRLWRSILDLEPEQPEAVRRIEALTGR